MKELTLADHAELWAESQNKIIPARDTKEWELMYENWVEFAFSDFDKNG